MTKIIKYLQRYVFHVSPLVAVGTKVQQSGSMGIGRYFSFTSCVHTSNGFIRKHNAVAEKIICSNNGLVLP